MECATVSDDRTLRIWDIKAMRMKKVAVLKRGGRCVAYHPNGETMAIGLNDGTIILLLPQRILLLHHSSSGSLKNLFCGKNWVESSCTSLYSASINVIKIS